MPTNIVLVMESVLWIVKNTEVSYPIISLQIQKLLYQKCVAPGIIGTMTIVYAFFRIVIKASSYLYLQGLKAEQGSSIKIITSAIPQFCTIFVVAPESFTAGSSSSLLLVPQITLFKCSLDQVWNVLWKNYVNLI
jgi:hypothetical protein